MKILFSSYHLIKKTRVKITKEVWKGAFMHADSKKQFFADVLQTRCS